MIWKTERVKTREELEIFLNKLEAKGDVIDSITMDQANAEFIVLYKIKKAELLSD
jgi:hypothetical protein